MAGLGDGGGPLITGVDETSGAPNGRASFVADDGSPLGFAGGLEFLAVARGGGAFGAAIGGRALLAAPCSVDGGASEIGGATDWPLALPSSQTPTDSKPRAKRAALLIRVLKTALVKQLTHGSPSHAISKMSGIHMAIKS